MTSLQKRLENILTEVSIIQEMLEKAGEKPPCCLTIHKDRKISCDSKEPMEKSRFLKECKACRNNIGKTLKAIV